MLELHCDDLSQTIRSPQHICDISFNKSKVSAKSRTPRYCGFRATEFDDNKSRTTDRKQKKIERVEFGQYSTVTTDRADPVKAQRTLAVADDVPIAAVQLYAVTWILDVWLQCDLTHGAAGVGIQQ